MIDDKGRIMGKISIIDILIVAVVLAGLAWFMGNRGGSETAVVFEEDIFVITYMSPSYPEFVTDYIAIGDSIEDFIKGGSIGTVIGITVDQGYDVQPDINGVLVKSPKEGYEQIEIVSEVRGRSAENGVVINGNTYLVGQYVTLRAGTGKLFIMIHSMERRG